ncbi:MAG: ribulose-phosphate 3-epimerase [Spirochaetia bacterium]|nr:ribulose-phosphate 3-epimerase [Spirochaetia bacterium]MDD7268472.1 ribulose-phosphate 3-epimerase [Treponema sp.]MDY4985925.1 ribulose-phosphate 3-epimerase [Treponema sp.]
MKTPALAPSLLSADFSDLNAAIKQIENNKGTVVHIDVMDGQFVPEITYGQPVVRTIRKLTQLPFDVHLMVEHPENQINSFIDAGADWVTFHIEATPHAHRLIQMIHEKGKKAGIALNPATPVSALQEILSDVDVVLVMTVNPGWGGQKLIPSCVEKIKELKRIRQEKGYNYLISVDGGVNNDTLQTVLDAGVDVFVSGSAFFNGSLKWQE